MINTVLDQASGLRRMNQNSNHGVKVIAVTGGKGGVGKTNVSSEYSHRTWSTRK